MTMMQALLIREYGTIYSHEVTDAPVPKPGQNEILVRVHAFALNYPDLLMLQGKYQIRHETPFVPGRDAAGVVDSVGTGVAGFKSGDRVACQVPKGAFAEQMVAPVDRCFQMPEGADFMTAAAMITPYNTAYVAVVIRTKVQAGEWVLVTGATGSVGAAMLQLAKHRGAKVIAGVSSPDQDDIVRAAGADHVVYTRGEEPKESIPEQVLGLTDGRGVDVVLETVGADVFHGALRSLAFEGRLAVVGFASNKIPEVKVSILLYRNWTVMGTPLDIHFKERPELMREGIGEILSLAGAGVLKPTIAAVVPLVRFNEAVKHVAERPTAGRVVVSVRE